MNKRKELVQRKAPSPLRPLLPPTGPALYGILPSCVTALHLAARPQKVRSPHRSRRAAPSPAPVWANARVGWGGKMRYRTPQGRETRPSNFAPPPSRRRAAVPSAALTSGGERRTGCVLRPRARARWRTCRYRCLTCSRCASRPQPPHRRRRRLVGAQALRSAAGPLAHHPSLGPRAQTRRAHATL